MATIEDELVRLVCTRSTPLRPDPPELPPDLTPLVQHTLPHQPRAVLLDIYGTLFVSGSGEVGTASEHTEARRFVASVELGTDTRIPLRAAERIAAAFDAAIRASHEESIARGFQSPEVDIVAIWSSLHPQLEAAGVRMPVDVQRLALAHELVSNPVWPMPGALDLLAGARKAGMRLGIVSNAQFYTRLLFRALLGSGLANLGFHRDLLAFSYETGIAKPNPALFHRPLAALAAAGIDSSEVVYLGNDMLNDVTAASRSGCMTALFAGDKRSLRLRPDDARVGTCRPDTVVRSLPDFLDLLNNEEI